MLNKKMHVLTGLQIPSYFTRIRSRNENSSDGKIKSGSENCNGFKNSNGSKCSRSYKSDSGSKNCSGTKNKTGFKNISGSKHISGFKNGSGGYKSPSHIRIIIVFSIVVYFTSQVTSAAYSGRTNNDDRRRHFADDTRRDSRSNVHHPSRTNTTNGRTYDRFSYRYHNRHEPSYRHQPSSSSSYNVHHTQRPESVTAQNRGDRRGNSRFEDQPHRDSSAQEPAESFGSSSFFNLASRADIVANATCGENQEPETYCKLVEHVKSRIPERIQCGVCDSRSSRSRHSASSAIDGSQSWWQSPSIANGKEFNYVTITLDLKQTYQVAYVIVKAANSPRPGNWILERSTDGLTYKPWQYFAVSASDCWNLYGVPASRGIPQIDRDDQVICTTRFSKLEPLENGEIYISLVNGRPGSDSSSQLLKDFTMARYVRLRFQRIHTLYADLMTFVYNDPKDLDPSVTNRYFYSIKDISIGGQCMCTGPSSQCVIDQATGASRCQCLGNTCGNDCDRCCPLYNQKPWQPAPSSTTTSESMCEECNCFGHSKSCVYNQTVADRKLSLDVYGRYNGGGVCEDCMDNTMGVNCEMCRDGYYRPSGTDPRSIDACIRCECSGIGVTGQCIKDDSVVDQGLYAGDCLCKEGYCGASCEECSPGYTGYPYCTPCPCDPAGSINMDTCYGECMCKPHVCGEHCDACLPGYFNLRPDNPDGCNRCFCFGISDDCSSSTIGVECLTDFSEWKVTDYSGTGCLKPHMTDDRSLFVRTQEARAEGLNRALYWEATSAFIGNKITSYGGVLEYMFSYKINDTANSQENQDGYLGNYDIIIESNGLKLGHNGIYYAENSVHHIAMNLTEGGWKHMEGSTSPVETLVPREEFLTALAGIDRMLIRASYHVNQLESRLHSVSLDVSTKSGSRPPIKSVEMCVCPTGYAGSSCEVCAPGYRRVGNILVGGSCVVCDCNRHSEECDPHTGDCVDCQHNTAGPRCDRCSPGFKGDARLGRADSCQSCACPLEVASNNFADDCVISPAGTRCYCRQGYEGNRCERCAQGYYGNPLQPGDYCKQCDCHGNSNPGHDCNQVTGKCKKCQGHTEGLFCDKCVEGYFGTAMNGDCQSCRCNEYGSLQGSCDRVTGQCGCKSRYTGKECGQCRDGYGNIAAGCSRCECSPVGSMIQSCDAVTGLCHCKRGVGGDKCGQCLPGYYGYSADGCRECGCDSLGSTEAACDVTSGLCYCRLGVTGRTCDQCQVNYWGVESGNGCQPCKCDPVGSTSSRCDVRTGQCQCQLDITGLQCDRCAPGYYGFSASGCKKCAQCASPTQVCDPITGECNCPPNTLQPLCNDCQPSSWGYDAVRGCTRCECDPRGALSSQCGADTGQCLCTERFTGLRCDQCQLGFYGFPDCLECGCDVKGTLPTTCNEQGKCECDGTAQCACKVNVEGPRCDRCKEGTFSLQSEYHQGCVDCFCSGRTKNCRQAPYAWSLVDIPGSTVTVVSDVSTRPDRQKFLVLPADVSSVYIHPRDTRAMYWSMPSTQLGDWTLSYNGLLQYSVQSNQDNMDEDSVDLDKVVPDPIIDPHPMVILHGNFIMRLRYIGGRAELVNVRGDGKTQFSVRFREDLWQLESGQPASREQLMVALQNVQAIHIKLRDTAKDGRYSMDNIRLERAIPVGNGESYNSLGVEQCICPQEYTGLSCQDPAAGFYRLRPGSDNVTLVDPKPSDLIGSAQACLCNRHSDSCDINTGACVNCSQHTMGIHCELCAPGYHGDARGGGECRPCQCPVLEEGQRPLCHSDPNSHHGYMCDGCPEGLGGDVCDQCAPGYYRDRRTDTCVSCDCSPQGSRSTQCDVNTGQCTCFPGIQGRSCDQCLARHAVEGGSCVPCDVGCTGKLFDEIDAIDAAFQQANITEEKLLPWTRVRDINKIIEDMKQLDKVVVKEMPDLEAMKQNITMLKDSAGELELKSDLVTSIGDQTDTDDTEVKDNAENLLNDLEDDLGDLRSFVTPIVESILGRLESGEFSLDRAISEAEDFLQDIYANNATMKNIEVDRERRLAENLLEKVKNYQQDHTLNMNSTEEAVYEVISRLKDLYQQTVGVKNITGQTSVKNKDNEAKLSNIDKLSSMVTDNQTTVLDTHSEGDQLNKQARELLVSATEDNRISDDIVSGLVFDIPAIEMKVGILETNVNTLNETVQRAVEHSKQLDMQASELSDVFNDTRESASDPLHAALSFDKMAEAINEAEVAVNQAAEIARNASDVVLDNDKGSLSEQAVNSNKLSQDLRDKAQSNKRDVTTFRDRLDDQQRHLQDTHDIHEVNAKKFAKFRDMLNNMTLDGRESLGKLHNKTVRTYEVARNSSDRIQQIQQDLDQNMKKKAEELKKYRLEGITKANASVNAVRNEIKNINDLSVKLQGKAETVTKLGQDIAYDLAKLRERIKQAREQANSIKVSLYHQDSCYRKYQPILKSATTNSVKLYFKTNDTSKDMLLFLLTTPGSTEYLAVEMVKQKLRFSWNTGGETTVINHPLLITTYRGVNEADAWFQVHAERVAHLGLLSVKRINSEFPAEEIRTASTTPAHTTLDVINTTAVFLGGVPRDYQLPGIVSTTPFSGCIGDVYLDNKPVGLYNFRELIGKGCSGCRPVPSPPSQENGMYQFDGTGYASVKQVPYNSKFYNILVQFKVIYKDALLFYAQNVETGDYVALELKQGRVVFTYNIQGISRAQLATISKYNTNTWVQVDARIVGLQSTMTVDQETVEGLAPDLGVSKMDLAASVLYFGGVPETVKGYLDLYNISSKSFLGCLKGIQITSKGPFDVVLNDGLYSGMLSGCVSDKLRVVGLDSKGHVELPSHDLPREGEFTFSFRTQQSEALLLLARGTQTDMFYSISLLDGHVEAWFSAENGVAKIQSTDKYNDGYYHTVTVIKNDRNLELYVDDQAAGDSKLAAGDTYIGSLSGQEGGLYLGGVPTGVDSLGMAASLQPLKGCLSDIIMGQKLLTLDLPVAYNQADIGRCDTEELFPNITGDNNPKPNIPSFTVTVKRPEVSTTTLPPKPDPLSCAAEGSFDRYSNVVAFGNVKHSHAKVIVKRRSLTKDFNITMEFRTFYKKGLMVYITNAAQTEYVAVEMINGKVLVSYEGKNLGKALQTTGDLNDGIWHSMRVIKKERSISVQVNIEDPIVEKINRKLDVDAPVYVGGLPKQFRPREGLISESFKGCMREFALNGQAVDLSNSLEQVKGITRCYKHAERGAYFDGFGYAIFAESYVIASEFSIELEFRTTHMDGLILSIASRRGVPALTLEIYQGEVVFTAINGGGRFSANSSACEFCLCDNNWHHVKADLIKNIVTLEVDGISTVGVSDGYERFLNTKTSMYIGGLPPYAETQAAANTEDPYIGCIKDMTIQGEEINWHSMHNLIDVHVGTCPISLE